MIKLSDARHPKHRPMTALAAVETFLDGLKAGPNPMPPIIDDIRTNQPIPMTSIRAHLNCLNAKKRKLLTRVMPDGQLVVYLLENFRE